MVATLLTACQAQQPNNSQEVQGKNQKNQGEHIKGEVLTIQTTPCFGRCPVYAVTIEENGQLTFDGKRFAGYQGKTTRALDEKLTSNILNALSVYRPQTGEKAKNTECNERATDHPSYVLTWQSGDNKTVYHHYTGCFGGNNRHISKAIRSAIDALSINDLVMPKKVIRTMKPDWWHCEWYILFSYG